MAVESAGPDESTGTACVARVSAVRRCALPRAARDERQFTGPRREKRYFCAIATVTRQSPANRDFFSISRNASVTDWGPRRN